LKLCTRKKSERERKEIFIQFFLLLLNNLIENNVRESAADISCRLREIKKVAMKKKTAFDNKKEKKETTKKNKTLCKHI
jgi:hypothetical protein